MYSKQTPVLLLAIVAAIVSLVLSVTTDTSKGVVQSEKRGTTKIVSQENPNLSTLLDFVLNIKLNQESKLPLILASVVRAGKSFKNPPQ